ncbi:hypothetical protein BH10PSE10_BH10PSE10_27190 [soil metagenome]
MSPDENRKAGVADLLLAALLIAGGLTLSGISVMQLASRGEIHMAQVTQPSETTPSVPAGKSDGPADSTPGGTQPTTPAPEPARPDADAQKAGAKPALPPAPAEKMGEPIKK